MDFWRDGTGNVFRGLLAAMLEDVVSMGHNELGHSMADLVTPADSVTPRTPQLAVCTEIMRSYSHQLK